MNIFIILIFPSYIAATSDQIQYSHDIQDLIVSEACTRNPEIKQIINQHQNSVPFKQRFDSISSTMLLSQKWDKRYVEDKVVFIFTAKQQWSGKGQKNNEWSSPSGNIYMTILTKQVFEVIPYIFMLATVSIAGIIQNIFDLKEEIKLKWVNDLLLGDRKIGGILVKSDILGNSIYLQIGIGINIMSKPVQTSTCLIDHTLKHKAITQSQSDELIEKLAIQVVTQLNGAPTQKTNVVEHYNKKLLYKNELVKIYDAQLKHVLKHGKFIGVNQYGFAILQGQDGSVFLVSDGRMRKQ